MISRFNFVIAGLCYKILQSIQKSSPGNAPGLAVFANDNLGLRIACLGEFEIEVLSYLRETFCLNTEKDGNKLIDPNTLMFVAIHELSHIATKSIGHKDEFWNNFKFLLGEAKKIGVYKPEDYKKNPRRYCGTNISDNPYFDM